MPDTLDMKQDDWFEILKQKADRHELTRLGDIKVNKPDFEQ